MSKQQLHDHLKTCNYAKVHCLNCETEMSKKQYSEHDCLPATASLKSQFKAEMKALQTQKATLEKEIEEHKKQREIELNQKEE